MVDGMQMFMKDGRGGCDGVRVRISLTIVGVLWCDGDRASHPIKPSKRNSLNKGNEQNTMLTLWFSPPAWVIAGAIR